MNHYTVRAIKGKRCVRRVDSWTIVNARNIYERLLSEFPGALVQIYDPDKQDCATCRARDFPRAHHLQPLRDARVKSVLHVFFVAEKIGDGHFSA